MRYTYHIKFPCICLITEELTPFTGMLLFLVTFLIFLVHFPEKILCSGALKTPVIFKPSSNIDDKYCEMEVGVFCLLVEPYQFCVFISPAVKYKYV